MWYDVIDHIQEDVSLGYFPKAIEYVATQLNKMPPSPFHTVLQYDFQNDCVNLLRHFRSFKESKSAIRIIYAEMNGFYINPDDWYFELFGYTHSKLNTNYGWLADWDSKFSKQVSLIGMEKFMQVYKSHYISDNVTYQKAKDLADLLIVLKFQQLLAGCLQASKLNCSVIVSAHEYDLFFKLTY
ncbi:MAG: hypothetical protein AAFR81_27025 [Chloroflexota bacterium]